MRTGQTTRDRSVRRGAVTFWAFLRVHDGGGPCLSRLRRLAAEQHGPDGQGQRERAVAPPAQGLQDLRVQLRADHQNAAEFARFAAVQLFLDLAIPGSVSVWPA